MELSESTIVSHPPNVILTSLYDAAEFESYTMLGLSNGSAFGYVNGETNIRFEEIDESCGCSMMPTSNGREDCPNWLRIDE